MAAKKEIQDSFSVKGIDVRVISKGDDNDYISLTSRKVQKRGSFRRH